MRIQLSRAITLDEFTTTMDEAGETDLEWSSVTLEGNLKVGFGDGTITNILGWREVDLYSVADIDGAYLSIFTAEQREILADLILEGPAKVFLGVENEPAAKR